MERGAPGARGKNVTLSLLWQEYKAIHPEGWRYSGFCERYREWVGKLDLVMFQGHRAGETLFIDSAGQTMPVVDPETGEMRQGQVFVAVLGASSYTYRGHLDEDPAGLDSLARTRLRVLRGLPRVGDLCPAPDPDPIRALVLRPDPVCGGRCDHPGEARSGSVMVAAPLHPVVVRSPVAGRIPPRWQMPSGGRAGSPPGPRCEHRGLQRLLAIDVEVPGVRVQLPHGPVVTASTGSPAGRWPNFAPA